MNKEKSSSVFFFLFLPPWLAKQGSKKAPGHVFPKGQEKKKNEGLFGMVSGELKDDLLASQTLVDSNESIELVLQRGRVLGIEEAIRERT